MIPNSSYLLFLPRTSSSMSDGSRNLIHATNIHQPAINPSIHPLPIILTHVIHLPPQPIRTPQRPIFFQPIPRIQLHPILPKRPPLRAHHSFPILSFPPIPLPLQPHLPNLDKWILLLIPLHPRVGEQIPTARWAGSDDRGRETKVSRTTAWVFAWVPRKPWRWRETFCVWIEVISVCRVDWRADSEGMGGFDQGGGVA